MLNQLKYFTSDASDRSLITGKFEGKLDAPGKSLASTATRDRANVLDAFRNNRDLLRVRSGMIVAAARARKSTCVYRMISTITKQLDKEWRMNS